MRAGATNLRGPLAWAPGSLQAVLWLGEGITRYDAATWTEGETVRSQVPRCTSGHPFFWFRTGTAKMLEFLHLKRILSYGEGAET